MFKCPRCGKVANEKLGCQSCGWKPGDAVEDPDPAMHPSKLADIHPMNKILEKLK